MAKEQTTLEQKNEPEIAKPESGAEIAKPENGAETAKQEGSPETVKPKNDSETPPPLVNKNASAKTTVTLRHKTPHELYRRAGIVLNKTYTAHEVTDEQLAILKKDCWVEFAKEEKAK